MQSKSDTIMVKDARLHFRLIVQLTKKQDSWFDLKISSHRAVGWIMPKMLGFLNLEAKIWTSSFLKLLYTAQSVIYD